MLNNEARQVILDDSCYCGFLFYDKKTISIAFACSRTLDLLPTRLHSINKRASFIKSVPASAGQILTMDHAFNREGRLSAASAHDMSRLGEIPWR